MRRSLPIDPAALDRIRRGLGLAEGEIKAARLLDGGLEQLAIMIDSRERLLALKPDWNILNADGIGLIAPWRAGGRKAGDPDFEVRVFDPTLVNAEDPVTGSFNASVARWLIGAGMAPSHYVASQGTAIGRAGLIHVDRDADGIWIGGDTADRISGTVAF